MSDPVCAKDMIPGRRYKLKSGEIVEFSRVGATGYYVLALLEDGRSSFALHPDEPVEVMPERTERAIQVWRWEDAPQEFRALSDHGGDEDWVALVPKELVNVSIDWMEDGTAFGRCSVSSHTLESGDIVRIGAHA